MAEPTVLIAQPARQETNVYFLQRAAELIERLTYPSFSRIVWLNNQPAMRGKYEPHAAARNQFIDLYLDERFDYVLWIDIDLIDYPADLVERLMDVSLEHDGAIVAPMVWDERRTFIVAVRTGIAVCGEWCRRTRPLPPLCDHGGIHYDIGGFIKDGQWSDQYRGVLGSEDIEQMDSVGTCYLVPAWLYRHGLRYAPKAHDIEHLSFCEAARGLGVQVLAVRDINILHPYLPNYGEAVH